MARLSINEMTTYRWTFEQDVANYRAAGIGAIGVWRQKLSDFGDEKGVELIADSSLEVSNLLWAGGFTGNDGRTFRESIDDAAEAIHLASEMRAGCLVVYSGARSGHTGSHAMRLLVSALEELEPIAAQHGVTLALEPMHEACGGSWTFLSTVDDVLDVIGRLGSSRIKMVFDAYHLGFDPLIVARLGDLVEHIAVVHLGDSRQPPGADQDRCRLGDGLLPLADIVGTLLDKGYDSYFDIELIGEEIEAADNVELLEHSQQAFEQLL